MTTVTAFRDQFPKTRHFPEVDDADIESALDEAKLIHSVRVLATLYCAAHLLALDQEYLDAQGQPVTDPDGGAGVVVSEMIGPRRIDYITQAGDDERKAFFVTTTYGRRFLNLEARTPAVGIGVRLV